MSENVAVLGSTGSIGKQTLEVIQQLNSSGQADLRITALSCGSNIELLEEQIEKYRPASVSVKEDYAEKAREIFPESVEIFSGDSGLSRLAASPDVDTVVNSLVGYVGLKPTLKAANSGKKILLANKESLVIGGKLVTEALEETGSSLLPIDSEHSAIKQCLQAGKRKEVERLIITASGGPFRDWPLDKIKSATPEDALDHPNWSMGTRITCDSATMVNKAFEVIEAHWLFDLPYDRIDPLIHHQSIIHSMVEFCDGNLLAQLGPPDMKEPIQYALTYPERMKNNFQRLNLLEAEELSFQKVEEKRYPAYNLILKAAREGGTKPAALNAADEELINAFMDGKIKFGGIADGLKEIYEEMGKVENPELSDLKKTDRRARKEVKRMVREDKLS